MLTFGDVLKAENTDPSEILAIRHTFVELHADGHAGLNRNSTNAEILDYTAEQSSQAQLFPRNPPRYWVVFIKDGGSNARLHTVYENHGVLSDDGNRRHFDLRPVELLTEYKDKLVISWAAPIRWQVSGASVVKYRIQEIAQQRQVAFPGFYNCVLDFPMLQAVVSEPRYEQWRTALSAIRAIYLIADTRDGKLYVGKADGGEGLLQRWASYAPTGHGGNVELRRRNPATFRFSILQVFDPTTPQYLINEAETHYKAGTSDTEVRAEQKLIFL